MVSESGGMTHFLREVDSQPDYLTELAAITAAAARSAWNSGGNCCNSTPE